MAKAIYSNCAYFQDSINIFIPAKFRIFPCFSFLPRFLSEEKRKEKKYSKRESPAPAAAAHLPSPPTASHLTYPFESSPPALLLCSSSSPCTAGHPEPPRQQSGRFDGLNRSLPPI